MQITSMQHLSLKKFTLKNDINLTFFNQGFLHIVDSFEDIESDRVGSFIYKMF